MIKPFPCLVHLITLLVTGTLLAACGNSTARNSTLQSNSSAAVDFSGSWELDYGQSDNAQQKLDSLIREMHRNAQKRARAGTRQGLVIGSGINGGASILGLVRLADHITQSPLLKIQQDAHKVRVQREGDFDLSCEFYPGELHEITTAFGTEVCGWNQHQLVFRLQLPDGLKIQHVMTRGAAGKKLNIATTVISDQVSFPFQLNRVYNRFEPGDSGYHCEATLSRGRVCTTESP